MCYFACPTGCCRRHRLPPQSAASEGGFRGPYTPHGGCVRGQAPHGRHLVSSGHRRLQTAVISPVRRMLQTPPLARLRRPLVSSGHRRLQTAVISPVRRMLQTPPLARLRRPLVSSGHRRRQACVISPVRLYAADATACLLRSVACVGIYSPHGIVVARPLFFRLSD